MDFVFVWVVVVEIDSFLDAGRRSLGFSVSIEIDLAFVWVVDIDLISVWEIELDVISGQGSELTCFMHGGRK